MIASGSMVAHYRVEEMIGAGGMGEIYRAVDSRLGRAVALKVLPAELSESPERLRRFIQEAKAASSLNHPHILTVYDAGEAELQESGGARRTVRFIATELVIGKTLRHLLHRERLPLKRLVGYLAQAADGIAKAHAAGIVHRDLKPENIMVTDDGFAKVLDFGLAKLTESRDDASTAIGQTRDGLILGTVSYMSPEQAQGKPVDHRSDIFAFGAILYEAAARRPPFDGASDPEILHKIIYEEPPPLANLPDEIDRLVTRALAKDPEERIQSMKDFALELRDIARTFDSLKVRAIGRRPRRVRSSLAIGGVALAVVAAALIGFALRRPVEKREPIRFSLHAPDGTHLTGTPNSATALQFAISPDGRTVAFVATGADGQPRLWLRDFASVEALPLGRTEGAFFPFWSPDGKEIAFFAQRKLKRISTTGGAPVILADANDARGGSWSRDGVILYVPIAGPTPIYRIPAAGGDAAPATFSHAMNEHHPGHRWPSFLPDGRRFLYFSLGDDDEQRGIWAGSLDSKEAHFVTASDSGAHYVALDGLLFVRKGALYFQRFDPRSAKASGDAVVVQRNVGYAPVICYGAFSAAGRVAAFAPWINPGRQLALLDRRGTVLAKFGDPADWGTTALSLHGENAILPRSDPDTGNLDLWLVDTGRNVSMRLTSTAENENHPVWSPDGQAIAHTLAAQGRGILAIRRGERSEQRPLAFDIDRATGWTPDGRQLLVQGRVLAGRKLWVVNASGDPGARLLRDGATEEAEGVLSPDGKWIAYASNEKGRFEVFVQPFPLRGERYPISTAGGMLPKWSPDGRELFFLSADKNIASVRVLESGSRFRTTAPQMLFTIPGSVPDPEAYRTAYAPTADGNFLIVLSPEQAAPATITVMVDWRASLD